MNRKRALFLGTAIVLILAMIGCSAVRPLCRSDESIRGSILKRTPLGSSTNEVYAFIKQHHWRITSESHDNGFVMRQYASNKPHEIEVGTSFVACELGKTRFVMFPFETMKFGFWGFDTNGRLVDVWVDEETDAL